MCFKIETVNNCVRCSEIKSNEDGELILGIKNMVVISSFGKNFCGVVRVTGVCLRRTGEDKSQIPSTGSPFKESGCKGKK